VRGGPPKNHTICYGDEHFEEEDDHGEHDDEDRIVCISCE